MPSYGLLILPEIAFLPPIAYPLIFAHFVSTFLVDSYQLPYSKKY